MDKDARFVAFTSGCGGIGTTSAALVLGRSLSRLCEKKVLFISFDLISSKSGFTGTDTAVLYDLYVSVAGDTDLSGISDGKRKPCLGSGSSFADKFRSDEYGMYFLSCNSYINPICVGLREAERFLLEVSHNYDYVIIDIPSNSKEGLLFVPCCEDVIVNFGNGDAYVDRICSEYMDFLKKSFEGPRYSRLEYGYDEDSFENGIADIHGEFGSEVRAFAEKLGIWPKAD